MFSPNIGHSRKHRVPGWNDYVRVSKEKTDFWHKIWIDAGSPRSCVLIKKNAKARYKYQVRKLKRREKHIRNQKLLNSFFKSNPTEFWRQVKRAQMSSKNHNSPIVNGLSDPEAISNKLSSKFSETLNTHSQDMFVESDLLIHSSDVSAFVITEECVLKSFSNLKSKISDSSNLDSNHFIKALPVITDFLSSLFTVLLRHGYLPACLKDCISLFPFLSRAKTLLMLTTIGL